MGEVKASKKTKASKITLFIDDNFYNDAETRNEDSKDKTSQLSKEKDGNWRVAKHYPRTEKKLFKNVNYTKFFVKPIRILRTKEETRWTSISSEATNQ